MVNIYAIYIYAHVTNFYMIYILMQSKVDNEQREAVKKKALQRQIEMVKRKMRISDEL